MNYLTSIFALLVPASMYVGIRPIEREHVAIIEEPGFGGDKANMVADRNNVTEDFNKAFKERKTELGI